MCTVILGGADILVTKKERLKRRHVFLKGRDGFYKRGGFIGTPKIRAITKCGEMLKGLFFFIIKEAL